jgi:beta-lactamase superfamily II metal-dependent hydrolase
MTESMQIRLVNVEFLRSGPPHNQLLSPLTPYLAICGDAGAGVISVPYEQATFERKLRDLRYETGDARDRQTMLNDLGVEMGRILGAVPGLPGALRFDPNQPDTLIHLRLTVSASELAFLPFELAKGPVGPTTTAESWLAIQTRPPVCVTRNIRTVSPDGVIWPHKLRILFVSGDPANVPFEEHRKALLEAIEPFQYPGEDERSGDERREQYGDLLTILVNPTLELVMEECRKHCYTHVHILAHGDLAESSAYDSYGLALRGPDDSPDVISGDRFCSALTSMVDGKIHRPTVVTLATCDSGNVGSVVIPGASFSHAVHQSGVALVVASQFPLSKEGSIPVAASLYKELLWGANPLPVLQQIHAELHARYMANWHDWASLVVYEALPQTLEDQLDTVRYWQSKRAMNAALQQIDLAVLSKDKPGTRERLEQLEAKVARAVKRLPMGGHYGMECLGLRASSRKRVAQAAYSFTRRIADTPERWDKDQYALLDQARVDYDRAAQGLIMNDIRAAQRSATLHWVLVQVEALTAILGKERDSGRWEAAKFCAALYLDHPDPRERAWARGSLAELCLVRLADPDLENDRKKSYADEAVKHAEEIARLFPSRDDFCVTSTLRQFERYCDWWGSESFEQGMHARELERKVRWDGENGINATARHLIAVLKPRSSRESGRHAPPTPPVSPSPASGGSSAPVEPVSGATLAKKTARAQASGTRAPSAARSGSFFEIQMLPAGHGDSLWIEYGDQSATHRLLVDCGTQQTARELLRRVDALPRKEQYFELFVMSHIDADHIGGALPFFKAVKNGLKFGDVWFNGWRHLSGSLGAKQGEMFSTAILDLHLPWNAWQGGATIVTDSESLPVQTLPGGLTLTLLSPTPAQLKKLAPAWQRELKKAGLEPGARVDYSKFLKGTPSTSTDVDKLAETKFSSDAAVANGSSIALLAEFGGASVLLGADAHAPVLTKSIETLLRQRGGAKRLKLDAFKVPHHGSQNNLSNELLDLLDCRTYCLSSNGDHFNHPDREAIGRIIKYGGKHPTLHFNYRTRFNDVWARPDLREKYGYAAVYKNGDEDGSIISLLPASRQR